MNMMYIVIYVKADSEDIEVPSCEKPQMSPAISHRLRRDVLDQHITLYESYPRFAEDLAYPLEKSQQYASYSFSGDKGNPFKKITMNTITDNNGTNIILPLVVRATISSNTIRQEEKDDIPGDAKINVDRMAAGYPLINYNYGHIVSFQNGGAIAKEVYNFFPLNPKISPELKKIEDAVNKWAISGGSVNMLVVFVYPENSSRPEKIVMKLKLFDQDDLPHTNCKDTVFLNQLE
ncbi:hypothetical protein O0L34_g3478 [Tuta absoluta]|nr:hypothetical protein O0L34_g3478 [Tuta absoluta]